MYKKPDDGLQWRPKHVAALIRIQVLWICYNLSTYCLHNGTVFTKFVSFNVNLSSRSDLPSAFVQQILFKGLRNWTSFDKQRRGEKGFATIFERLKIWLGNVFRTAETLSSQLFSKIWVRCIYPHLMECMSMKMFCYFYGRSYSRLHTNQETFGIEFQIMD